jgi:hypothetical protein
MSLISGAKKIGKALSLDYLQSLLWSAGRLAEFRMRFGVKTELFPSRHTASGLPIDIVIPVIDKDSATLGYVIDSARENIRHPVKEIYLVCPGNSDMVKKIGIAKDCVIIDERELVATSPKEIRYIWEGHDRGGWVYQQLLKWSGGKFCTQKHYLVIDSDTVFLRPQVFEINGRKVFDFCDEYHQPYFRSFEKLFGIEPRSTLSFTSHHALIDIEIMGQLLGDIESLHGMPWHEAIVSIIDQNENSCISDYDNYGQYIFEKQPDTMCVRYWHNKSVPRGRLDDIKNLSRKYRNRFSTLSFHSYK